MTTALCVIGLGATTAVGLTAPQTCAAYRARCSGYRDTLRPDVASEPFFGAVVPAHKSLKWPVDFWLLNLATRTLRECLANIPEPEPVAVLLSLPEAFRAHPAYQDWHPEQFLSEVQRRLGRTFHPASTILLGGHAAGLRAVLLAKGILLGGSARYCAIAGVDSSLNAIDYRRLNESFRLHQTGTPQGVIPGEGAAAVLLTLSNLTGKESVLARLLGAGVSSETDTALGPRSSTGVGLSAALKAAVSDAGVDEATIDFRVADMNGERYRGMESMYVEARFYRTRRRHLPAWYPAMSVGDLGAAAGPLLLVIASDAINRGYAPGPLAMCEASSDEGLRAGCLIAPPEQSPDPPFRPGELSGGPAALPPNIDLQQPTATIPEIVSQHAEEVAFLWSLRRIASSAHNYDLAGLAETDDRIVAHLAGLVVSGSPGWQACEERLTYKEPGEFFAGAALALEHRDQDKFNTVVELSLGSPELKKGVISALGWTPLHQALPTIEALLQSEVPGHLHISLAAASAHRWFPGDAPLSRGLRSEDRLLRARSLRSVGEFGRNELLYTLLGNLEHPDPSCRFWASWSATLLGDNRATHTLNGFVQGGGALADQAALLVARRRATRGVAQWLERAREDPSWARSALIGAGASGNPSVIPALLTFLQEPLTARLAGAALSLITGLDLEAESLQGEAPEDFQAGPTDDPGDDDVAMDPDGGLPWPDPETIDSWWRDNCHRFTPGVRYLLGRPISATSAHDALLFGTQTQRMAAALELVLLQPGPLFEVRAPGWRQKALLNS